ncbi:hypothetical protein COI52_11105 [Bacillus toyonensis]|nr:hypothetical protein COI52_11105 [Bacillus toyonensis]
MNNQKIYVIIWEKEVYMRQIHGAIYIYITMFFVAISYGLGHVYLHPILTFLSGACMAFALLVHLFSVWIVKFQLNISEIEEGTF